MKITTKLLCIAFFAIVSSFASVQARLGESSRNLWLGNPNRRKTYFYPRHDGYRLDYCMGVDQMDCGESAADEFCIRKGYELGASNFRKANDIGKHGITTKCIGDGQLCEDESCDAFSFIQCTKASHA